MAASAILGPQEPYCKVIHDALIKAGIRENLIYIVGGWGMTQEWCDKDKHALKWHPDPCGRRAGPNA